MLSFTLVSSQFKFTRVHRRADTHTRGELGRGDAALLPPVQEAHQGLQQWRRLSRSPKGRTVGTAGAGGRSPGRGGRDPRVRQRGAAFLHSLPSEWNRPPLRPGSALPILPGSAQTRSPRNPVWGLRSSCWLPKAVLTALGKDPACLPHKLYVLTRPLLASGGEVWAPSSALDPDAASLILTTRCTGGTGPISQMRTLRPAELTSWGWGPKLPTLAGDNNSCLH